MIQNIEDVSTDRLRKMLGSVKRALNVKMGAISKMKKPELLNKITELKYKWNPEKQQLTTNSMIRKKSVVDLPPRIVRKPKPLTQEKKVKLIKKIINDNDKKKALTKKAEPKKEEYDPKKNALSWGSKKRRPTKREIVKGFETEINNINNELSKLKKSQTNKDKIKNLEKKRGRIENSLKLQKLSTK